MLDAPGDLPVGGIKGEPAASKRIMQKVTSRVVRVFLGGGPDCSLILAPLGFWMSVGRPGAVPVVRPAQYHRLAGLGWPLGPLRVARMGCVDLAVAGSGLLVMGAALGVGVLALAAAQSKCCTGGLVCSRSPGRATASAPRLFLREVGFLLATPPWVHIHLHRL